MKLELEGEVCVGERRLGNCWRKVVKRLLDLFVCLFIFTTDETF